MNWFVWLFLFAVLMFIIFHRYSRKKKPTKFPQKDLLHGYDSTSKGSTWSSPSLDKGTGMNYLKVAGESHDQDAPDEIFRHRTDEGVEKKDIVTILVEDDDPEG